MTDLSRPTDRRFFNGGERVALYLAADGRCARCGEELAPGWHADHRDPYAAGGRTELSNGQPLCPRCNLKKGSTTMNLRAWQTEALARFHADGDDFLCVATPGAGKTTFALAAAKEMMERGDINRIVIVVPTKHLRVQWKNAAHRAAGIQLDSTFQNSTGAIARDYDGVVVTYQAVASTPALYRKMVMTKRTLVILDEVHHGAEDMSWGAALRSAFEPAERRLLLSGTPFRSDGGQIPFITYDTNRMCVASYSYDYGQALADREGVVRQIAFPAFDGEARWLEASAVESTLRLSDSTEDTRAKALNSALMPAGQWIGSVLRTADEELSRQRELVPDAGGLVIAKDQSAARQYAQTLKTICGEMPTVAISDEPDASAQIERFANAKTRWIVAVAMVSEGVDIPRLAVGVYATTIATELFFRQVVGRFVRTRGPEDETCAQLYIPSVQPLLGFAVQIETLIPKALKELEEKVIHEGDGSGGTQLMFDVAQPLDAGEAIHTHTILSGETFPDAELQHAEEMRRQAGLPSTFTSVHVAQLLRVAGHAATAVVTTTIAQPASSIEDTKLALRKQLVNLVNRIARRNQEKHAYVNNRLNQATDGGTVARATVDGLRQRIMHANRELATG